MSNYSLKARVRSLERLRPKNEPNPVLIVDPWTEEAQELAMKEYYEKGGHGPVALLPKKAESVEEWIAAVQAAERRGDGSPAQGG